MHYVESNTYGALASGTCCQTSDCLNVNFGLAVDLVYNGHLREVNNSEEPRILVADGFGEGFICTREGS